MAKKITAIPATLNRFTSTPVYEPTRRRVAGYARVSTDLEEQQSSYQAQMDYYRSYIMSRPDWEFVDMYSDEGITATNTRRRDGFNSMIADALDGKIDLIITKSISRFARNTVDSLITIRKLKDHGVEVYFEKENIWTFDSKGELLISIMSSLAQEESRSISENTTWGKRKSFAAGKASVAYSRFLGYDKGFVINEEEAETVRMIYKLFMSGKSLYSITKELERLGRKTATGLTRWTISAVKSVLTNEKYKGDAILQKEFTTDYLQKTKKKNEGEVPKYYINEHHPKIVSTDLFQLVQVELQRRRKENRHFSGATIFSFKLQCGECGGWYGPKVWHSNQPNRCVIYRCNQKYHREKKCTTPHFTEDQIKQLFLRALNKLTKEKKETIENLETLLQMVSGIDQLKKEKEDAKNEMEEAEKKLRDVIQENAHAAQDQGEYGQRYHQLYEQYEQKIEQYNKIEREIEENKSRSAGIKEFIDNFAKLDCEQTVFDEQLWAALVHHVTVYTKTKVTFTFIGGIEVALE